MKPVASDVYNYVPDRMFKVIKTKDYCVLKHVLLLMKKVNIRRRVLIWRGLAEHD